MERSIPPSVLRLAQQLAEAQAASAMMADDIEALKARIADLEKNQKKPRAAKEPPPPKKI